MININKDHPVIKLFLKYWPKYRSFVIYCSIGFIGAFVDFGSFALMVRALDVNPLIANPVSMSMGIVNNFMFNAFFNFKQKNYLLLRLATFYAVGITGMILSNILLKVFYEMVGIDARIVKFVSIPIVAVMQYFLNKSLTFSLLNKLIERIEKRNRINDFKK